MRRVSNPPSGRETVPFARALASHQDRTAVVTADGAVSYRRLATLVDDAGRRLGDRRRLILLAAGNTLDSLVVYLAALATGNPVLLTGPDRPQALRSLIDAYDPDVVAGPDGRIEQRRPSSAHDLHPDLALLLSTAGTTGAPKLVRLSHQNVQSNAESIAGYLGIGPGDRAATTLPMCYCYGLSVINTHLLRGAALILTDLSVIDRGFWELLRATRATGFAGVPYTFDLLDRVGFTTMRLPHLRYLTQAGGRMPAEQVARYAAAGRAAGWDLYVMYGQTEATARMAYLPPELAGSRPEAIGLPIPGGSFTLKPDPRWPCPDTGELVYSGPNVMLGYANGPADLRLGRTVTRLRTGDIARRAPDGLYEVVGRRGRFVKICGLRVDPDHVEQTLSRHGLRAVCTGDDDRLVIAVGAEPTGEGHTGGTTDRDTGLGTDRATRIRRLVARELALPARRIEVQLLDDLPRLPTGKPDYQAILRLPPPPGPVTSTGTGKGPGTGSGSAAQRTGQTRTGTAPPAEGAKRAEQAERAQGTQQAGTEAARTTGPVARRRPRPRWAPRRALPHSADPADPAAVPEAAAAGTAHLRDLYARILDRPDVTDDSTFVGLGGDSLSYVEMSVRLEETLGTLPDDWHLRPIRDLSRPARRPRRRTLETSVALRAAAIVLIVGSHIPVFMLRGGAHVLLAVAGFNFARFHLTAASRRRRRAHVLAGMRRIAVPSVVWITFAALLTDRYHLFQATLLHSLTGRDSNYWFIEVLVYVLLAMAALLSLPALDRAERRHPFATPLALLVLFLLARFDVLAIRTLLHLPDAIVALWMFPLGWAAAKATAPHHRALVTLLVLATVPGYFGPGERQREALIIAGVALLIWVRSVPSVGPLNRVAGLLAGSTMCIYLTHWQVYPLLRGHPQVLALVVSLAAGIGLAALTRAGGRTSLRARMTRRAVAATRRAGRPGKADVHGGRTGRPSRGSADGSSSGTPHAHHRPKPPPRTHRTRKAAPRPAHPRGEPLTSAPGASTTVAAGSRGRPWPR